MGNKVIRCIVSDDPISKNDSGFGSRLISWGYAHYLNLLSNFKYKILIDGNHWPEVKYLNLPNTEIITSPHSESKLIELQLLSNLVDVRIIRSKFGGDKLMEDFCKSNLDKFCEVDDWTIVDWFNYEVNPLDVLPDILKDVSFKYLDLNEYFKTTFGNYVGVHIRRGFGIWTTKNDFDSIPDSAKKYYLNINKERQYWRNSEDSPNKTYRQRFIRDKCYYEIFDKILGIKSNQKFYISTDIPIKALDYYKDKYNIVTRKEFFNNFYSRFYGKHNKLFDNESLHVLAYLFDFFALCNTKMLILSQGSSWSMCAKEYSSKSAYIISNTKVKNYG